MLARIAAETFERNEYFIPQPELEKRITDFVKNVPPHDTNEATDGEAILKAIEAQHGIFVERARAVYSFSHLTFQEYFTSKYIVEHASKGRLKNLVKKHCTDARWREVFLLTTSLLPDAAQFMTIFRQVVDELLEGDEKLRRLLNWADKKSAPLQSKGWLVRPSYLFITFYYGSQSDDLTLALARALALDSPLELALARARDLDSALELSIARKRELNLANARDLSIDINRALARANAYEVELNDLIIKLASLSNKNVPAEELQQFADNLRAFLVRRKDTRHERSLTEVQEERLISFLNATRLLQDCLELATMPPEDKKAMLNSLYLPPAQVEDGQNAWGGR
jgi:predicted NACHT family NTPase